MQFCARCASYNAITQYTPVHWRNHLGPVSLGYTFPPCKPVGSSQGSSRTRTDGLIPSSRIVTRTVCGKSATQWDAVDRSNESHVEQKHTARMLNEYIPKRAPTCLGSRQVAFIGGNSFSDSRTSSRLKVTRCTSGSPFSLHGPVTALQEPSVPSMPIAILHILHRDSRPRWFCVRYADIATSSIVPLN